MTNIDTHIHTHTQKERYRIYIYIYIYIYRERERERDRTVKYLHRMPHAYNASYKWFIGNLLICTGLFYMMYEIHVLPSYTNILFHPVSVSGVSGKNLELRQSVYFVR